MWHPDSYDRDPKKHPAKSKQEAEDKFKEIGEAYAVLSDPEKRRAYDRGGNSSSNNASASSSSSGHTANKQFKEDIIIVIKKEFVKQLYSFPKDDSDEVRKQKFINYTDDLVKEARSKINGMKTEEEITRYLNQALERLVSHASYLKKTKFASEKKSTSTNRNSTGSTKSSSSSASSSSTSSTSSEGANDYSSNSSNSSSKPKSYEPFTCDYCYYYVPSNDPRNPWVSSKFPGKKFCKSSCADSFIKSKLSEKEHEETMRKIREDSERSSKAHREWMRKSDEESSHSREEHEKRMRNLDDDLDKMKKENDEYWNKRGARRFQKMGFGKYR